MQFAFTEDQTMFRDAAQSLFADRVTPDALRATWTNEDGSVPGLWSALAEMGLLGMLVDEQRDGLGLRLTDAAQIIEQSGAFAVPDPLGMTLGVVAPLLEELGHNDWLARVVSGAATVAISFAYDRYTQPDQDGSVGGQGVPTQSNTIRICENAASCDALLFQDAEGWRLLERGGFDATPQQSVDRSRRLATIAVPEPSAVENSGAGPDVAKQAYVAEISVRAYTSAVIVTSLQLVGLSRRMLDMTTEYAKTRVQFGKPIGAQQAVKHQLANALIQLEFARPLVYRAALSLSDRSPDAALHASMAKAAASDAAIQIAKTSLQLHGAMGYSYEYDLHLWMKRAWALAAQHGDAATHRAKIASLLLDGVDAPTWDAY